jgi:tRNA dimethylallyltransferase
MEMDTMGPEAMIAKLSDVDPAGAAQVDVSNARRIQRLMEVWYTTGRPLSSFWSGEATSPLPAVGYVLNMDRTELYDRINRRVDIMFDSGLMQEVASILEGGVDPDLPPLKTIGYKECIQCLRGEISRAEARRLVARNTRRYAKRQLTWLRRYKDLKWLDIGPKEDPVGIVNRILEDRAS